MAPTNSTPPGWSYQPWSYTGHKSQFADKDVAQPDNAGKLCFYSIYNYININNLLAKRRIRHLYFRFI